MLSEFTINELRKLEQYMLEEPRRFNLNYWGMHIDPKYYDDSDSFGGVAWDRICELSDDQIRYSDAADMLKQKPPCGTMACLAGNYLVMTGAVKPHSYCTNMEVYAFTSSTPDIAGHALGLTEYQRHNLFYPHESRYDGWPKEWQDKLDAKTPGTLEYAQVAVDRIEHFIATGGDE